MVQPPLFIEPVQLKTSISYLIQNNLYPLRKPDYGLQVLEQGWGLFYTPPA